MSGELKYETLRNAVSGTAAAFRCITELQPAGGAGDKVFPPTYEGGQYATEKRRIDGQLVDCVLLDSVQSQANRMELAIKAAWKAGKIKLPVINVDFSSVKPPLREFNIGYAVTSLDAPHRLADAILRDSMIDKKLFKDSDYGKRWGEARGHNATAIFELCPTALLFGMWGSPASPGRGAKFQRAIVSEIIGFDMEVGTKTSSRIDPLEINLQAGPVFLIDKENWTLETKKAAQDKKKSVVAGKDGNPSAINHGNIPPTVTQGGVTISKAVRTVVVSLPALRRLSFPISKGKTADTEARTVLAAMGICATVLAEAEGFDLRSRCQLVPAMASHWELLDRPGKDSVKFTIEPQQAMELFTNAVEKAKAIGLPWLEQGLTLTPSDELVTLVRQSQEQKLVLNENDED